MIPFAEHVVHSPHPEFLKWLVAVDTAIIITALLFAVVWWVTK